MAWLLSVRNGRRIHVLAPTHGQVDSSESKLRIRVVEMRNTTLSTRRQRAAAFTAQFRRWSSGLLILRKLKD